MSACATKSMDQKVQRQVHTPRRSTVAFPVSGSGRFEEEKRSSKPLSTKRESVAGLTGGRRTSNKKQYNTRTHTHTRTRDNNNAVPTTVTEQVRMRKTRRSLA